MATDAAEPNAPPAAEEAVAEKPAGTGFWLKLAAVGGLLMIVMILEFLMLYFFFGKSDPTQIDPNDPAILDAETLDDTETAEIDISPAFNCTNSLSHQGQAIHISFNLHVEVPSHLSDRFTEAKKNHKNRIRQSVITIIRSAAIEELNDPNLSMIKRQIREEINKILNQSYVTSVIITDYRKMEQ
ncbi:flagellar basal body-associated FliL family protein [Rubinisphaera margarita]|uniref:flagellar basal body-associated FliL family protein n=1 Tax=Rubinisphaera margarita TaxID=2909586 RepID=UPI001EE84333|nr:flagellar basal body-associated FliL family protein [Rubinisphaera margarita]MCG6154516.1 flagellar basal body-associated FliL family protein [Rubinisphaera margarita]